MQIVINISKEKYDEIMSMDWVNCRWFFDEELRAIHDGKVLPKGHGRIGDLDELIKTMEERNKDNGGEPLNAVDRGYDLAYQHMIEEAKECVIIEADIESEAQK